VDSHRKEDRRHRLPRHAARLTPARAAQRWEKWRPTVGLCQQEDLIVHRLELLHDARSRGAGRARAGDIAVGIARNRGASVEIEPARPLGFRGGVHDAARLRARYPFDPENEDYLCTSPPARTWRRSAGSCWPRRATCRAPAADLAAAQEGGREHPAATRSSTSICRATTDRAALQREHDDTVSFLKSGIATRNAGVQRHDRADRAGGGRSRAPMLLIGPTGAGKSFLARRVYELKKQRQQLAGASSRSTARRCAATAPCRRCSAM
jgi:transcriptional regulatory protein RtcR